MGQVGVLPLSIERLDETARVAPWQRMAPVLTSVFSASDEGLVTGQCLSLFGILRPLANAGSYHIFCCLACCAESVTSAGPCRSV